MTPAERFWSYVAVCPHGRTCRRCHWDWHGTLTDDQYGRFSLDGKLIPAMRMALMLHHGAELLPFGTVRNIRRIQQLHALISNVLHLVLDTLSCFSL